LSTPFDIGSLAPDAFREVLPSFLAAYVDEPEASAANLERVRTLVSGWSDETTRGVMERLACMEPGAGVLEAHPACRELERVWAVDVVKEPTLDGVGELRAAMEAGPTVLLGNHLSYFDASALDCALAWSGHGDVADRIVAAAGPKVYEVMFRRIAAACINTLPVPQTTRLAHTKQMSGRELARQALASLKGAKEAAAVGQVLLLYPEGSRTRTGHLGSFVRGVHRYLAIADEVAVVPCSITGTERIMPLGATRLTPGTVHVRFGSPLRVGPDGDSKVVLEQAFHAVASLLPEAFRPLAETPPLA